MPAVEHEEKKQTERVDLPGGDRRLKELIVYIAGRCQTDDAFGAIKLNKILFNSDFRAYRRRGTPITGTPYFRLVHGPAPRAMVPIMRELQQDEAVVIQRRFVAGFEQKRAIALRPADLTHFSGEDIAIVDEVIDELWGKSATAVSQESHGIQWRTRFDQDPIPYEAAYLSDDPVTVDDWERAKQLEQELGLDAESS